MSSTYYYNYLYKNQLRL